MQEPTVHYRSGTWKMWYTGSFNTPALGYASCTSDPTSTGNWTKYVSNPVLGQGGSGVAGWVSGANIYDDGSTPWQCFYYDASGGGNLKRSTSSDGLSWSTPVTAISSGSVSGTHGWANSTVWKESSTYYMLVEASTTVGGGPPWVVYLFTNTSISGDGAWSVQNSGNPLSSLQVGGFAQGYGQGPNIAEVNGILTPIIGSLETLWYHVSEQEGSLIVSNILHGRSTDRINWTPSQFDISSNRGQYELQQAADPCVLEAGGTSYLFYTGLDNVAPKGYINLATFTGTLAELLENG